MDNAPIHRKTLIKDLVASQGHEVIFLPKYSRDLNDIEHDFGALKKNILYEGKDKSVDDIIRDYCVCYCLILIQNNYNYQEQVVKLMQKIGM